LVVGSNPAEPTKSQVLSELLELRELLGLLLGSEGKRKLELRQKTNEELFSLYDGELIFHHRSGRGLHEARRMLRHFHNFLGEYPPTVELAKAFLGQFSDRKATTLYRYTAIIKSFMAWYGDKLDIKIRVPKMLPDYVDDGDIDKLTDAMRNKKSHKRSAKRDLLLVDVAVHTGLRRGELANLKVGDIGTERQALIVRLGKGQKDRAIPLSYAITRRLEDYMKGKPKEDSLFGLAPATISGKIHTFAKKAGVNLHTHSLRDRFATSLAEAGVGIREIQMLLGHDNINNTERYILLTGEHLRQAIDLLDKPASKSEPDSQTVRSLDYDAMDYDDLKQEGLLEVLKRRTSVTKPGQVG